LLPEPRPFSLAPCSLCQGRFAPAAPVPLHSRAASLTAAARGALPEDSRDEGMVLPIELKDVVIDLSKPVPRLHDQFAELDARNSRRLWTDRVSAPASHNAGRTEWQASAFAYCRRSSVEQATWLSGLEYFPLRGLQ
jgi:hypothetical protein